MTLWHEHTPTAHALPALQDAIPRLRTPRLHLRAPVLSDFPLLAGSLETAEDPSLKPENGRTGAWAEFMQMTATWVLRGHGWWTVDDHTGPQGFVGIGFEPGDHEPELGYIFAPAGRNQGYATEACTAARDHARGAAHLPSLVSYISDSNAASQNVARKLGAARDPVAEAALKDPGVQVWRHWHEAA